MDKFLYSLRSPIFWILVSIFVAFYPMLISIYVFLPLLIGTMGYIFLKGIETGKFRYIFITIVYFINLEVNLSLPFFLTIVASLLVYNTLYEHLSYFRTCQICKSIFSVIFIDVVYLALILSYDFIFNISSVVLDNILFYTLIVDILVVVTL